jgi:5'-3' exonuclease
MAKTIEKLMIWDGNNHFRRCAGNKGLVRLTFKGKPTGAIHGTIKRILTDIQAFKPTECVVVFDGAGARVEKQKVYEGYKAHRTSGMDESLHYQMNVTRDILRAAGICVLQKPGVDADDAIGALASLKHRSILVNSNDKDFLSLVNDWCSQIRDRGNGPEVWTAASVRDHKQEIDQIDDFLLTLAKPKVFSGKESTEIKYDRQFEDMCLFLSHELSLDIDKLSVLQFYNSFEYIKKQRRKNGR